MKEPLVILQARTGSTRLPGKVLKELNSVPMIMWQVKRINQSGIGHLVVATTDSPSDDQLVDVLHSYDVDFIRGPIQDVAQRFNIALLKYAPQDFIRLTADCPLFMPEIMVSMWTYYQKSECEYLSNTFPPSFPDGLDIEIIKTSAFLKLLKKNLTEMEKEHVTLGLYRRPHEFKVVNYENSRDLSNLRWTVDYEDDFEYIKEIYSHFQGKEATFDFEDVLELIQSKLLKSKGLKSSFRNISLLDANG